MAKNERTRLSSSDTKVRASWVNNATKSLQITGQNVLKSFAPNLYEVTTSATKTSRDIIKDIRQNKYSVNNIHRNLKNNKYIKYAQDGLKNALDQVRTGNFNDPDAADKAMMHSFGFDDLESMLDDDGGISFGDDGAENNVDVDINVSNSNAGMFALSEQLRSQTEVSLQTSQANLDAMIALNANSMMQTQKISTEIISGLNAINQNLASLVEYNNSSMSKFITSSIAYYEKMGSRAEEESSYTDSSKVTVNDVLRGNNGNINFTAYKDYVKTNFKKTLKDTEIGQIASMVMNDQFIETMVANPVGTMVDMLSAYIVPTTVQNVIKGAEATFNSVVPKMLHQLSEWGETETGLKKYIGKTFGVTVKRQDTLDKSTKIEKGAVPFDGITRHTINEIITKELSEQTAYLKAIAQKIRVKDVDKVKNQAEVFDFQTGNYTTVDALQEQLRKDIQSNISWAFDNSDLGKEISSRFMKSDDTELTKKEKQRFLDFLHLLDERNSGKYIDLGSEAYTSLINQASSGTNTSTAIKEEFKRVIQDLVDDPDMKALKDSYHSLVYEASKVRNERLKYYEENPYETHLYRTGNITSIDEFMGVKNGTASGVGHRNGTSNTSNQSGVDTIFNHISQSIASTASGIVSGLAAGSLPQAFENIKSTFQSQVDKGFDYIKRKVLDPVSDKIRTSIFGIADENGVRSGGLFAGVLNSFGDATKNLKWHITGQEYIDSNGVRHEAKSDNETIVGTFKSIGRTVKDSLTSKFSALTDENTGIVPTIKSTIHEGLVGWQEAIFGKTLTEDERKDLTSSAVKSINERLPSSMVGAATGTFAGAGLLGSLIGGPVGGAILGTAVGFASKSEKFQKFIFGEIDEEGNRVHEGMISQKVQDYVKDNKKELIGSGVVGAAVGSITGAGLLGTLVGGPVAGAVLGIGTSVLKKSNMFNEFLFGSEKNGQTGLIQSVKDIFGKYSKSTDGQKDLNKKVLGMGALGAGAGAITAAAIGKMGVMGLALGPAGPIGGALLGLGASMLAQKDNFHKWLFGEKDENGEMKSAGLINQFGNMIKTSVFMPLKDSISNYAEDIAYTVQYEILDNIRFGIQPILDKTLGIAKKIGDKVTTMFTNIANGVKEFFSPIVDVVDNFVIKPVRKLVSGVTNIVYQGAKFIVTAPFKLIGNIGKLLKNKITDAIDAVKTTIEKTIITPIKNTITDYIINPIKNKVKGFFTKIGNGIRNVATNVAGAFTYLGNKWYNVGKPHEEEIDHTGEGKKGLIEQREIRKEQARRQRRINEQNKRERKIRTKNSEIIRKATGGMYTEDTEENRQKARMNEKYKNYDFGGLESLDQKWKREKQEKDERSTAGMSENNILNANLSQLDPESQQVSLLSRILNVLKGKGDSQGYVRNNQDSDNSTQDDQQNNDQVNEEDSNSQEEKSDHAKNVERMAAEIASDGGIFKHLAKKYKKTKVHRFSKNIEDDLRANIGWYGKLFSDDNNDENGGRGYASGTESARPGLALVGEGGTAELVHFHGGEKVYSATHPKTQAYMSTVANATGTMGLNENNIVNSDIKKLDTQSQQVQILLRILAVLKGKPSTTDAKDIKKLINSERSSLPATTNINNSEHEKTRSESFQDDINSVSDRIEAAGGLRGYTRNAIRGSISRAWNRSLLKRSIDTATNVTRGISNAVRGTATRTLGLGKYLLNRGISAGRNAKSLISGIFGNKEFSAQDDLDENENTNIEDSDDKQSNALALISERRDEQKAEIESDRKARMAEAIDKGLTAEERQAQIKEEKERSVLDVLKESSQAQVTEQRGFTKLWSSIFSKKGLITGSLLLAAPFVIKLIRKIKNGGLWNFISGGLRSIGDFLKEKALPFYQEHVEPLILSGLEKIGGVIGDTISSILPSWLSGSSDKNDDNITTRGVLDENGNWDNESGARLKLGTKLAVKGATIVPGIGKTFTTNASKYGLKRGTTKTIGSLFTKSGRKGISKVGSDELIKSGNKKFRTNIRNIFHGAANTADNVGGQVFDVIPVESVGSRIVSNTADDVAKIGAKPILALPSGATADIVKGSKSLIGSTRNVGAAVTDDVFVDVAGETFKDLSDDVGEAVVKKARKTVVGETIEKAGGVLKDKVVKIVSKFADKLVELVEKKIGTKLANTGIGKIVTKVTQCLSKHFSKISAKVSAIFGAEAGLATTGIGLLAKDAVFCTLTAINGVSGTARLFQVDQENVDWVMKTISGALGFFNGTLVGSICDVVNELIVSVMGIDFYTSIASIVYKAIMAITGNKNKAEALNLAQGEFKDKYEAYVNDESQTSLDNAKRLGLVDSNMTLEEYKATYTKTGSDYKSFADYNDEQHQTIGSRMFGGLSKVGNAIVSPFVNKKTTTVTDANGNTYVKNKDGTYTAKDSSGKEIGVVSGTLVENLENTTSETKVQNGLFGKLANTKAFRAIGNFNVNVGKGVGHFFAGHEEDAFQASDGTYYTTDGKHYNQLGYNLGDSVSPDELQEMLNSGYVTGPVKFKVASGYTNMGASIGRGVANFGNNVASGTKTVVNGMKQGLSNFATGVGKAATTIKDKAIYYANPLNVLADIIRGGRKTILQLKKDWDNFTDNLNKLKNTYSSFFNEIVPEFMDNAKTKLSDLGNKYSSFFNEIVPEFMDNAKDKVSTFFDNLGNNFSDLGNKYSSFFNEIVPDMITNMKNKLSDIKNSIDKKIDDLGKSIINAFTTLTSKISNKITGAVDGVKKWWNDGKENLKNALAGNGVGLRGGRGPELAYATAGPSFNSSSTKNITFAVGNIGSNNFINKSSSTNKNKVNIRGYIASDNSYYDADGVHYNAHGDKIGSDLSKEELKAQFTSGILKESKLPFVKSNDDYDIENGSATILKKFNSVFTSVQNKASHIFTFMENGLDETFDNIASSVDVDDWKPVSGKAYYDPQGNYYILTAGNKFNYCNTLGDVIGTATKADVYNKLKASILKEYSKPNITNSIANDIKSMRSAVTKAWSAAKNSGTSKWSAITKLLKGGRGSGSAISKVNSLSGYTFVNKDAGDTGVYDALSSFREYATTYRKTLNEGDYTSTTSKPSSTTKNTRTINRATTSKTNSNTAKTDKNSDTLDNNTINTTTKKKSIFGRIVDSISNKFTNNKSGGSGEYVVSNIDTNHKFNTPKLFKKGNKINKSRKMMNGGRGVFGGRGKLSYDKNGLAIVPDNPFTEGTTNRYLEIESKKNTLLAQRKNVDIHSPTSISKFNSNVKKYAETIDSISITSRDLSTSRPKTKTTTSSKYPVGTPAYEEWQKLLTQLSNETDDSKKKNINDKINSLDDKYKSNGHLKVTSSISFETGTPGYEEWQDLLTQYNKETSPSKQDEIVKKINKLNKKYDSRGYKNSNYKDDEDDDGDDDDDSTSSSSSSSSSSGGKKSSSSGVSGSIFDILGSFFGEFASRASEGILTGEFDKNWSSFWGNNDSSSSDSSDDDSSSDSSTTEDVSGFDDLNIIQSYATNNPIYQAGNKITDLKGIVVHSTATPGANASSFASSWNSSGVSVCVHGFIDYENGDVYQLLPWDMQGAHVCSPGNQHYLGFEMCETPEITYTSGASFTVKDKEKAKQHAQTCYKAAVKLFAYLCVKFNLDPSSPTVISHDEIGNKLHISNTDHVDPEHYWDGLGTGYTMDGFRADVKKAMKGAKKTSSDKETDNDTDKNSSKDGDKDNGGEGRGRSSIIKNGILNRLLKNKNAGVLYGNGGRGEDIRFHGDADDFLIDQNKRLRKAADKLIKKYKKEEDEKNKINGGSGVPYYSQTDKKWANDAYGNDGATMEDTGCGPTVMAMVTSGLTGRNIKPTQMASLANATGMRDETGTNAGFINVAANTFGLTSNKSSTPNSKSLYDSAKNGPTVLLGQNESGINNPFTDAGHYVVTDGVDSNGNINIKDPRGRSYNKKYNANDLANTTSSMWDFGGNGTGKKLGGFGRKLLSRISRGLGGFGRRLRKIRGGSGNKKWMSIVKNVKKQLASKATAYKTPANVPVTIGEKTVDAMPDCSGYVCTCLIFYGVDIGTGDRGSMSPSVLSDTTGFASKSGFSHKDFSGWDACGEGDIVGNAGHCEIFSHMDGNIPYVYNCGFTEALKSETPVAASTSPGYTYIWSPGKAGSNSVNTEDDESDNQNDETYDEDSDTSLVDAGTSWRDLSAFERINAWTAELANRTSEGALTGEYNEDWNSFWDNLNRSYVEEDEDDGDSSYVDSSSSSDSKISGSDRYEKFWNFFTKNLGISKIGTSGFMGCYQGENEINPEHLECDFTSRANGTYADLTQKVKNALTNKNAEELPSLYDEYMNKVVIPSYTTVSLNLAAYKGKNGHYYPGMGFGSWTPSDDYVQYMWDNNLKWDSMEGSLKFFKHYYLDKYGSQFKDKIDMISNADSPESAAAMVMDNILMPGTTWSVSNPGHMSKRSGFAREFYEKYAGGSGTGVKHRKKIGGRGVPYYSQTDDEWAKNAYGNDGATMEDTGCGPTAMAMVTSSLTGEEVKPTEMASLANATGMRDETGTNAGFIDVAANSYGLSSRESVIPDSSSIYDSAKNGPTVLLGQNESGINNPFTDAGHYVVTDGVDSHGMINIKDPRGRSYNKKYSASDLANTTSSMWDFGGNGKTKKSPKTDNLSRIKINRKRRRTKGGSGVNRKKWLSIVRTVKKMMADKKLSYNQGGWTALTIDGVTNNVRQDCTGLIGGCLGFYGVLPINSSVWTGIMLGPESEMAKTGFTCSQFTSWKDLTAGDIVVNDVHGEIFSRMDGDTAYVYNAGSTESICRAGDEPDNSTYTWVWSPCKPGENCVTANEDGSYTENRNSDNSESSTSTNFKNKTLGKITSWLSEFANRSIEGIIGGTFDNDWDSFWSNIGNDDSDEDSSDNSDLNGSTTKEKIWNYLISKNISKNGAAGIMGCWEQESNNEPNTLEGGYLDPNKAKEAIKNNKNLDDYTLNFLFPHYASSGISVNKAFYNQNTRDGHYYPGFGLAQWTGINGEKLMDYAKKKGTDWWDLKTQLDFFWQTLNDNPSLKSAVDETSNASSAEDAATVFLAKYESGGSYSDSQNSSRRSSAKKIYEQLGGSGNARHKGGKGQNKNSINSTRINDQMFINFEDPRGTGYTGNHEKASVIEIKRYKNLKKEYEKSGGGYGDAIVDNTYMLKKPKPPKMNNFNNINNITDVNKVMNTIVGLLESIAGNTNSTSEKLDYLRSSVKDIKFVGGNTTNNILNNASSTGVKSSGGSTVGIKSRNRILAEKIARGI